MPVKEALASNPIATPTFRDALRQVKATTAVWFGLAVGALAVGAIVLVLRGFGVINFTSSGIVHLDPARVALQIQTDYKDNLGIIADVKCPENLVAPLNFSFKCMAQSGAAVATVNVTIVDVLGNILWVPESDLPSATTTP